jgi:peroxiredoxin
VEEMPDLVRLANSYESENVKVIGISIDYPEEIQSKIIPFIKKHSLNFPVYVNNFKNDETLINSLNSDWSGAIPATFVYNKDGTQVEFLLGKHSFTDFRNSIEQVL